QVSSSSWHRASGSNVEGWRQDRRDRLLSLFAAQRNDGLGWRVTATFGTGGISHDTLVAPRNVSGAGIEVSQTWRNAALAATARFGAAGLPQQYEARDQGVEIGRAHV